MQRAMQQWPAGSVLPVAAAALLLGGAVGKSAQLPLQTWLPDAMAGPTPTSALIHAATMVTSGVYLIARTHVLFALAPAVMTLVAIVGALTLIIAGFSALTQWDIKRILAYSTISQVGYMFLALGVGAWSAGVFHFVTHAFFKALLFLGAGVVILAMHEDHNIFHMGGLRKQLPLTFWTFLIASASLAALPFVTAGFYSKDLIISDSLASTGGNPWLWAAALFGAFLTSLYTFRMVFVTFWGDAEHELGYRPGFAIKIPLMVLALLSIVGGFINVPSYVQSVLPETTVLPSATSLELFSSIATTLAFILGLGLAYWFYVLSPQLAARLVENPAGATLHRFWFVGWGFDWLYDRLIVRPFVWLAQKDRDDVVDWLYQGIAELARWLNRSLTRTESGRLRYYAMGIALGAVLTVAVAVLLWY
jgi:NADH-quinone oxidoreductase subunit L